MAETSVRLWSEPVVLVEPNGEVFAELIGGFVGVRIGPVAKRGLNEAFRLAIGPGRVGPGPAMRQAETATQPLEGARALVGAIVGENALETNVEAGVTVYGPEQRSTGAAHGLVGEDGGEGDMAVVIDGHVDILPAHPGRVLARVVGDVLTGPLQGARWLRRFRPAAFTRCATVLSPMFSTSTIWR